MVNVLVNLANLYTYLANNSTTATGFIAYPVTLSDGRTIAGLYRGYGTKGVAVTRAPKPNEKGFRSLGPIEADRNGNLYIRD